MSILWKFATCLCLMYAGIGFTFGTSAFPPTGLVRVATVFALLAISERSAGKDGAK